MGGVLEATIFKSLRDPIVPHCYLTAISALPLHLSNVPSSTAANSQPFLLLKMKPSSESHSTLVVHGKMIIMNLQCRRTVGRRGEVDITVVRPRHESKPTNQRAPCASICLLTDEMNSRSGEIDSGSFLSGSCVGLACCMGLSQFLLLDCCHKVEGRFQVFNINEVGYVFFMSFFLSDYMSLATGVESKPLSLHLQAKSHVFS